jgi:hypothetical protein
MRVFAGCAPFIKYKVDVFSEMSQWLVFFVLLSALLLRIDEMGEGFKIPNKDVFDTILVVSQILAPVIMVAMALMKGKEVTEKLVRKVTKSISGAKEMDETEGGLELAEMNSRKNDEESGLELVGFEVGAVTLGGADGQIPRSSKFSVDNPVRDTPIAAGGTTTVNHRVGGDRQATTLLKVDSKGNVGPSNACRPNSSFDVFKNPNLTLGGKGKSKKNKKNIGKDPPERKSKFAIPKDKLEEAPIRPPKIPPPPYVEDSDDEDVGPPPYPPPAASASPSPPKPTCQWTEEWDEEVGTVYYLNVDGKTSTWDMPDDFWRESDEDAQETLDWLRAP